jgi:LmbE family N-acetylglucosaminyl deacetylase
MDRRFDARRILGLFPHPDDEAYAAGGTLALCALGGAAVTICCATRGENGSDRDGGVAPGEALGRRRTAELEACCRILGARPPVFFDLPDGRLERADARAVAGAVARLVDEIRPHVAVTLGPDGAYGSIDHIAWTRIVSCAAAQVRLPRLLHAAFPKRLFASMWRSLHRIGGARLTADLDPSALGTERCDVDLCVDIRGVRDVKRRAVAAHRSQLRGGDPSTFLRPGVLDALLDEEWFVLAAGEPLPGDAADPFAGL